MDRLDVACGDDLAVDVDDVAVLERAHDLADRVGLADVGEELVAQPLPLARTAHDAGDVDEGDRRRQDLLGPEDLRQHAEPLVGQRHDADVRVDRRERVVRREHGVLGQRVEQRRLADVGETDDSDGECHGAKSLVRLPQPCGGLQTTPYAAEPPRPPSLPALPWAAVGTSPVPAGLATLADASAGDDAGPTRSRSRRGLPSGRPGGPARWRRGRRR